jgi:hypothetical protein
MDNKGAIIDRCILDVFDLLTRYYSDNRVHIEGWKTNEAYKVGIKFILPRILEEYGSSTRPYSLYYEGKHVLNDLDIIMCFITGQKMYTYKVDPKTNKETKELNIITCEDALTEQFNLANEGKPHSKTTESTFFELKFYKKGTIHFKFKSKQLWQWFNCKASELRGYPLPEAKEVYSKSLIVR